MMKIKLSLATTIALRQNLVMNDQLHSLNQQYLIGNL
ncbi:MAG: hypothetical protein ACI92O_000794 [Colwellia sp.]|jgi:hypothetical protein